MLVRPIRYQILTYCRFVLSRFRISGLDADILICIHKYRPTLCGSEDPVDCIKSQRKSNERQKDTQRREKRSYRYSSERSLPWAAFTGSDLLESCSKKRALLVCVKEKGEREEQEVHVHI